MEQDISQSPLAVYIHIPFCLSKCHYCSFFSVPYARADLAHYTDLLRQEISAYQAYSPDLRNADTLYFGGGTPSLLSAEQITDILTRFSYTEGAEITLEVNPIQITREILIQLKDTEINRLSIGLQSMRDEELVWLSRRHRSSQIPDKIMQIREAGYHNFSLDLMYGLPGATLEDLSYVVDRYLELKPAHISAYLLTLEDEDSSTQEQDDLFAAEYEMICRKLIQAGYIQYEISNFALPGYESRHNLHYWQSNDYLGLGASASGFLHGKRYTNPADLGEYEANVLAGRTIPNLEEGDHLAEDFLMMGLRLLKGIDLAYYKQRFGRDIALEKKAVIDKLTRLGLLHQENGFLRLTGEALFISNAVIGEIIN